MKTNKMSIPFKLFKIIYSLITILLMISIIQCSTEEEDTTLTTVFPSFEEDPLYGTLNDDSTVEDYISVFLEDAKRHGVDYKV